MVEAHKAVAGTEIVEAAFFGIVEPRALAPVDGAFVIEAVFVVDMVEWVDSYAVGKVIQLVLRGVAVFFQQTGSYMADGLLVIGLKVYCGVIVKNLFQKRVPFFGTHYCTFDIVVYFFVDDIRFSAGKELIVQIRIKRLKHLNIRVEIDAAFGIQCIQTDIVGSKCILFCRNSFFYKWHAVKVETIAVPDP